MTRAKAGGRARGRAALGNDLRRRAGADRTVGLALSAPDGLARHLRRRARCLLLALLSIGLAVAGAGWTDPLSWSAARSPAAGPARVLGSPAAGCVQGSARLAPIGKGFEVLHLSRQRASGHPTLVEFIEQLAARAIDAGLAPLLVGDLSQARGGPMPSDHGSHQTGLDVDVAFVRPSPKPLSPEERERHVFLSVVDLERGRPGPRWTEDVPRLLELAATGPHVDRIFVHPVVKRELCGLSATPPAWIRKLRPWWGHDDHFHVRLRCPERNPGCVAQAPVPPGPGCGADLGWWLGDGPRLARAEKRKSTPKPLVLPSACRGVLDGDAAQ